MKTLNVLGFALLAIGLMVPASKIEVWASFAFAGTLSFFLAFCIALWEGSAEDVL